eukprot:GHVS01018883.1.p1 GENE.GHVS01018883.1~~GHVS01018883.1.p1  ORF type:complete len:356 (+),score=55.11 GHVS01018883.1:229-1296(+)
MLLNETTGCGGGGSECDSTPSGGITCGSSEQRDGSRQRTFSESVDQSLALRKTLKEYQSQLMPVKHDVIGYPRILLVARRHVRKGKYVNFIGEYHLDLIQRFGGAPVIVPRTRHTIECLDMYMPMDGFMITEGEDLGPEYDPYGGCIQHQHSEMKERVMSSHASNIAVDSSKDKIEWELLQRCRELRVPFLGICRGAQMLNVSSGGSLYFDLEMELPSSVTHLSHSNYDSHRHSVKVIPGTPLASWFREQQKNEGGEQNELELNVNSYHHQGVRRLADRFEPMCHSDDGLVEAFYDPSLDDPINGAFCVGLQFHPERMIDDYSGCARVYGEFVEACWTYRRRRLTVATDSRWTIK